MELPQKIAILFLVFLQKIQTSAVPNSTTCVTTANYIQEMDKSISCINNNVILNNQITVLQFTNSKLPSLSIFAFKSFLNVLEIHLNASNIQNISINAFAGSTKLKNLYLNNNQLKNLQLGCFNQLENLEILDLSKNLLESVDLGVFNTLENLKILNISRNYFLDVSQLFFYHTGSLEIIDLSYNALKTVDPLILYKFRKLRKLFINDNQISRLVFQPYDGYQKLQFLDTSSNQITHISTPDFKEFNMNDNPIGVSINMGDEIIHISRNNLPGLIITSSDTRFLNASWNKLTSLGFSNFQQARGLRILDVSHNKIATIASDSFSITENLMHLNLSHNLLQGLKYDTFDKLINLETLDISYNQFHYLYEHPHQSYFGFCSLIRLQRVSLYGNPLSTRLLEKMNFFKQISRELYQYMSTTSTTIIDEIITTELIDTDNNFENVGSEVNKLTDSTTISDEIYSTETNRVQHNLNNNKTSAGTGNNNIGNTNRLLHYIAILIVTVIYFMPHTVYIEKRNKCQKRCLK